MKIKQAKTKMEPIFITFTDKEKKDSNNLLYDIELKSSGEVDVYLSKLDSYHFSNENLQQTLNDLLNSFSEKLTVPFDTGIV